MSKLKYSIFVNSSDGFIDCWPPFFILLKKYWPHNIPTIYLNTENIICNDPNIKTISTQVNIGNAKIKRLSWSECFIRGLNKVHTPIILYLQEDYFIESTINVDLIESLVEKMLNDYSIKHIGLTNYGSCGPFTNTDDNMLWKISDNSKYRISCQAGLWRKDALINYLIPDENAWMFEIFGTKRASRKKELFLTVSREINGSSNFPSIIKYTPTGIVKGRWQVFIPKLFNEHGINLNYGIRGFYEEPTFIFRKFGVFKKLIVKPSLLIRYIFSS